MTVWDPTTYLQFADERSRPFVDLLGRVKAIHPKVAVDLGCGPGQLTASQADRWLDAQILGLDSSLEIIRQAAEFAGPRVRFQVHLRDWRAEQDVDVIISNAALQRSPGHRDLLPSLVSSLRPAGWLAFQVPGNIDEPNHRLLRELSNDPRYAPMLTEVEWPAAADAAAYLDDLAGLGCSIDAWETTYLHLLSGPDPVFRWMSGTAARPVLQALPEEDRLHFVSEYQELLHNAYPPSTPYGTVLPFRRVFIVAHRGPDTSRSPHIDLLG
jgi:trans-aconitate 2-methyltransferase